MFLPVGINSLIIPNPILPIMVPSLDGGDDVLPPQRQDISLPRLKNDFWNHLHRGLGFICSPHCHIIG
ncbi:MAG TPA: hypothetical protein DEB70_11200 [Planctomycetaceae bacterium]|nr:hypothetical protein [Planctomycetaceae bacterium]